MCPTTARPAFHTDATKPARRRKETATRMHNAEPAPISQEIELNRRSDKVESPQQYSNWRDYAFSEAPEEDIGPHR